MFNRIILYSSIVMFFSSCLEKYDTYGVAGAPTASSDGKYTAVIIAECDAITHQENGGYRQTNYHTVYWLKLYETASGKLLKKKKLGDDPNHTGIDCYGIYNNTIWLYTNGIRGLDISTLEETANEEKIARANNIKLSIFPYGDRLVNAAIQSGYIDFTSGNGEEFRLSLSDQKITSKEEMEKGEDELEKKINHFLNHDEYGTRCDTLGNKVYIFAKDSSAASIVSVNNNSAYEVAYRMKLFSSGYTTTMLGSHTSFTYLYIQQATQITYLNPCFVKDHYSNEVVHLSNPGGYLVIHQDVLGEKSKAIITRIDTSGNKIWETALGASTKISGCVMSRNYCIITSNKDYMLSPHVGKDMLCIVNTENGNIVSASLKE